MKIMNLEPSHLHNKEQVIDRIKSHPEMHFKTGSANNKEMTVYFEQDSILEGAKESTLKKTNSFWLLSFKKNWLNNIGEMDYFTKMKPLPNAKPGEVYSGILAYIFADTLGYSLDGEITKINGDNIDASELPKNGMCIYFNIK